MKLDWLLDPVSPDQPCGPDLEQTGDEAFLDYYYEAEARLPERYFTPSISGTGNEGRAEQVFDPKSVNLRQETAEIEPLLRRSRDLRLLSLLARFQILAGRLPDFADTLTATAALIEARTNEAHPQIAHSVAERRGALDELGSQTTVIQPLLHLPLGAGSDATLRRQMAATGAVTRRDSEEDADEAAILSSLRSPGNAQAVDRVNADLTRAADALGRIAAVCAAHPTAPFRPAFADTLQTITQMQALMAQARPDLSPWTAAPAAEPQPAEPAATGPAPAPVAPPVSAAPVAQLATRAAARAELEAIEGWLAAREPSSPALLLVTQARLLIGRPLVEALETLMPGDAGRAVIAFSPETGFALPMERLRALSQAVQPPREQPEQPAAPAAPVVTRLDLAPRLRAVEEHFRLNEPASPIPILLARARGFLDKGFEAVVTEMIPRGS